jgi:hypothetical protein
MTKKKLCHELIQARPHHWLLSAPSIENQYSKGECKNCGHIVEDYFNNRPNIETFTRQGQRVSPISINGRIPNRNNK